LSGRNEAVSKESVLKAVHEYKIVSHAELAKQLGVNVRTIDRRFKEITDVELTIALGVAQSATLTPAEHKFDVFQTIPEVKTLSDTLLYKRQTGERYRDKIVRGLFNTCLMLEKHPTAITVGRGD
jgi:hypothetical protein